MKRFLEFLDQDLNDVLDFIAEDFLFEEEGQAQTKVKQPWPDFEHKTDDRTYSQAAFKKHFEKHIKPRIDKIQGQFHRTLNSASAVTKGAEVKSARKRLDSLHDKVVTRGRNASEIHDVLRGAVITKSNEDADKVINKLKDTGKVISHEHKEHSQDGKSSGYGGTHHVIMNFGGVHTEVQVMPKKIFNAKKDAHKIYKKYRSLKNPESHPDYEKDMEKSRSIFKNSIAK